MQTNESINNMDVGYDFMFENSVYFYHFGLMVPISNTYHVLYTQ